MAWIDVKKVYHMVIQIWIMECLKMYKISNKVRNFITKSLQNWKFELRVWEQNLTEVKIQRGNLKRDLLWPLQFVIEMMLLNYIVRTCKGGYKFTNSREKFNHLMYIYDAKVLTKIEDPDTNNNNVQPGYRNGIWHWKSHAHNEKRKKKQRNCQIRIKSKWLEKNIIASTWNIGHHRKSSDERKIRKEYLRRTIKLHETKLYRRTPEQSTL